ncbi:hypothetical protein FRC17_009415 [Serendipita sp. 399]|nr:hypothetical protein FRC17_009415 [Serendipita sp. 399]
MPEWSMDRPQPSSITLDIKLPSSSIVSPSPTTPNIHAPEPFQLQITIQFPTACTSGAVVRATAPAIGLPSSSTVVVQDDAVQREHELRNALNQRKLTQITATVAPGIGGLPTPSFTSHSESPMEASLTDSSCDPTQQNSPVGQDIICSNRCCLADSDHRNHHDRSYSRQPSPPLTREVDPPSYWRNKEGQPEEPIMSRRDSRARLDRSAPPPCTPPGSPPRARSLSRSPQCSPGGNRGRSISHSPSRSRNWSLDSRDDHALPNLPDRSSSPRYSGSRSNCSDSYDPESSTNSQNQPVSNSLQDRITEERKDTLSRRPHRICPFYHSNPVDKHPLGKPHPGYQRDEFEEAVSIFENGGRLPDRLVKSGVEVNYRMQSEGLSPLKSRANRNGGARKRSYDQFTSQNASPDQESKRRRLDSAPVRRDFHTMPHRMSGSGGYGYPSDSYSTESGSYRPYRISDPPYHSESGYYRHRSYSDY